MVSLGISPLKDREEFMIYFALDLVFGLFMIYYMMCGCLIHDVSTFEKKTLKENVRSSLGC